MDPLSDGPPASTANPLPIPSIQSNVSSDLSDAPSDSELERLRHVFQDADLPKTTCKTPASWDGLRRSGRLIERGQPSGIVNNDSNALSRLSHSPPKDSEKERPMAQTVHDPRQASEDFASNPHLNGLQYAERGPVASQADRMATHHGAKETGRTTRSDAENSGSRHVRFTQLIPDGHHTPADPILTDPAFQRIQDLDGMSSDGHPTPADPMLIDAAPQHEPDPDPDEIIRRTWKVQEWLQGKSKPQCRYRKFLRSPRDIWALSMLWGADHRRLDLLPEHARADEHSRRTLGQAVLRLGNFVISHNEDLLRDQMEALKRFANGFSAAGSQGLCHVREVTATHYGHFEYSCGDSHELLHFLRTHCPNLTHLTLGIHSREIQRAAEQYGTDIERDYADGVWMKDEENDAHLFKIPLQVWSFLFGFTELYQLENIKSVTFVVAPLDRPGPRSKVERLLGLVHQVALAASMQLVRYGRSDVLVYLDKDMDWHEAKDIVSSELIQYTRPEEHSSRSNSI